MSSLQGHLAPDRWQDVLLALDPHGCKQIFAPDLIKLHVSRFKEGSSKVGLTALHPVRRECLESFFSSRECPEAIPEEKFLGKFEGLLSKMAGCIGDRQLSPDQLFPAPWFGIICHSVSELDLGMSLIQTFGRLRMGV